MLTLEMAIRKIKQLTPEQQQKVIEFIEFLEFKIQRENQADPLDETPDAVAIEGIKEGLHEAINGETIPLAQMWEGIDISKIAISKT